jgi:hypothetical protein
MAEVFHMELTEGEDSNHEPIRNGVESASDNEDDIYTLVGFDVERD